MISQEQFEEWMKEVERRPGSAALILQFVFNRLRDLTARNEELLDDNIALRSEHKVEEFESKIANLEYQLELLRRQYHGEAQFEPAQKAAGAAASVLLYSPRGQALRIEFPEGAEAATLDVFRQHIPDDLTFLRLLATNRHEELLFVFDTGRTETHPVMEFPAAGAGWEAAAQVEPRTNEQLAALLAIAKLPLYQMCVQISRRGYARRLMMGSFQQHVQKNYIGTGIKARPDQTCALLLAGASDRLVLVSHEGFLLTTAVDTLPYTSEEMLRLSATDYIVGGLIADRQPGFAVVTQTGKLIHREADWLEPAESTKSRGQPVFSTARREAGVRVIGAFPVFETDWAVMLRSDGSLARHKVADLLQAGSVPGLEPPVELIDIVVVPSGEGARA